MNKRDRSHTRWNGLADLLSHMRDDLDRALAEAERQFAAAPDEPFSQRAMQAMVATARERAIAVEDVMLSQWLCHLNFTAEANAAADHGWAEGFDDQRCRILVWQPRLAWDELTTHVDSTSIDTRPVRWMRTTPETPASTDPLVLDVWAGWGELAPRHIRKVREGTLRWDARLDAAMLDDRTCWTISDFTDYDDEVIKELLRN